MVCVVRRGIALILNGCGSQRLSAPRVCPGCDSVRLALSMTSMQSTQQPYHWQTTVRILWITQFATMAEFGSSLTFIPLYILELGIPGCPPSRTVGGDRRWRSRHQYGNLFPYLGHSRRPLRQEAHVRACFLGSNRHATAHGTRPVRAATPWCYV